ncbi:MAG: MerR family transcriptional regulator [Solirubrobacterales bacterium]
MSEEDDRLKISELADEAGVPVATVRHYLREGLLPEGEKTSRNMAYYEPEAVERIRVIKRLQEERYMPLRVIGGLLARDDCTIESLKNTLDGEGKKEDPLAHALADERIRTPRVEVVERSQVPEEVLERLEEVGVLADHDQGYSPSDIGIIEAVQRFRAGGFDEKIGFTVHDAAELYEPLRDLADREVDMLDNKLFDSVESERVADLVDAAIEPLQDLISAMHTKALVAEIERRRGTVSED